MRAVLILVSLALAACASPGVAPSSELSRAITAIEDALAADANHHAPAELKMAQDKVLRAQAAIGKKNFAIAKRLAEEAEVDARLAQARSQSERADRDLAALNENVRALREKIR